MSFNTIQVRKPSRNTFDLSHDHKYSMDMGKLVPTLVQEVLPGDVFNIQTENLIRFSPLIAPVMHNIKCFTHYFFVPNRIVWPNWEDFISPDLSKTTPPAWPNLIIARNSATTFKGTLWDYFGLPTGSSGLTGSFPAVSALPFACYQKIYDEYYRDQNLITEVNPTLTNGLQSGSLAGRLPTLRTRSWQHDYFTAALPFAQKGPAVELPIATFEGPQAVYRYDASGSGNPPVISWVTETVDKGVNVSNGGPAPAQGVNDGSLYVNLGSGANTTINDLRTALRLQEFYEKAARGGSRYVEQLKVHWNVNSSDKRMQRPEFLGGNRTPVIISEVLQTSETQSSPQANMAGHGISAGSGKRIRYYAEEHGYIIGIMSVMPSTAYYQGLPRHFSRDSWEDYAWPTFAHLGEQAILNKELYTDPTDGKDGDVFGYIPRYSEYRYSPSRVSGDFRDNMRFWHMARKFDNRPLLNADFINANPRKDIFAVMDSATQNLWCHSYHKIFVKRALPKYGTPTL